jgi:hypothetical protein
MDSTNNEFGSKLNEQIENLNSTIESLQKEFRTSKINYYNNYKYNVYRCL